MTKYIIGNYSQSRFGDFSVWLKEQMYVEFCLFILPSAEIFSWAPTRKREPILAPDEALGIMSQSKHNWLAAVVSLVVNCLWLPVTSFPLYLSINKEKIIHCSFD